MHGCITISAPSVRHRIDGLEMLDQILKFGRTVRHRIDGLEIVARLTDELFEVRHRIDGLEKWQ